MFAESILNSPLDTDKPLFAVKCALTSDADGPVYVNTPVELLYDKLPSPPASVTDTKPLTSASVLSVKDILISKILSKISLQVKIPNPFRSYSETFPM